MTIRRLERNERATTRSHSASGPRILGFQNAFERCRDGAIHRTCQTPGGSRNAAGAARPSFEIGQRFFGCARVAEISRTAQWPILQHAQHGFLPRQAKALLYW